MSTTPIMTAETETIPEDIPEDIWKYAESVERVWRDQPPRQAIEHHARRILAERERAASIAETHPKHRHGGWSGDPLCHSIARAIRNAEIMPVLLTPKAPDK